MEDFVERMRCVPRILAHRNRRLAQPFSQEELEDLAQEVFTRMWNRLGTFRGEGSLETWAYRFCALTMLDALRARPRSGSTTLEDAPPPADDPPPGLEDSEHAALSAALAALPDDEGATVQLKLFDGLSFEQTGQRLAISPNTAKTRYYRALGRMRQRLRGLFSQEEEG